MTTAQRIQNWRLWAGLSQAAVAGALNITPAAVSYWETDKTTPTAKHLEEFAAVVGVSMERFYGVVPKRRRAKDAS